MVRVSTDMSEFTATMADVSSHGGMMLGIPEGRLGPGRRLRLSVAGIAMGATIRWVRFDTCGVEFDRMLSERELLLARKSGWRRRGLH